jgi:hypothetical protein
VSVVGLFGEEGNLFNIPLSGKEKIMIACKAKTDLVFFIGYDFFES